MSDERLRELERRWRVTGLLDDRVAFLRERVRVLDRPGDRLRLSVHDHDAAATRAAVAEFVEAQLPALEAAYRAALTPRSNERDLEGAPPRPTSDAWKREAVAALGAFLGERLGPWFGGLGGGFGAEAWCACHSFFGYQQPPVGAGLGLTIDKVVAHVELHHRVHAALLETFDELDLPADDPEQFALAMADATRRLVDVVVRESGCDDAWYTKPAQALALLLDDKGLEVPGHVLAGLDETFSGAFESWIAPSDAQVQVVADAVALALAQALFEERYGGR
jgi:hypothetical protein